ncbi:uncharacterized protein PWA37_004750 [Arxiozyma heterogenica]|uniref:uncharacterized protein n=1 Tax=Arxiozyma heterogenica TaxID=278026 RepID=UPI002F19212E
MSQILEARTPTGSPKKSPFKPVYPRNSSPIAGKYNFIKRSPLNFSTRCVAIDEDARRKSVFMSNVRNDSISILSGSTSVQNVNINANKSRSSSPIRSNSGSPLKNLVNSLNGYERSSPLRRNKSVYFSPMDQSNESSDNNSVLDNIPFPFYEESQSDREAVLEQYFTKKTTTETLIDQENVSPNDNVTKINRKKSLNHDLNRSVFNELTSKEYEGSITDPKTEKIIYLHYIKR